MERRRAGGQLPLPAPRLELRREAGRGDRRGARRPAYGKQAQALRRELHGVLRQVDYDYQRMQYNTVVSGAMKMLNALEDFKGADAGAGAALREGWACCCACSTR